MADRNPRVLFVGRSRHRLPLPDWLAKKWDAIEEVIDYRVLGAAEAGSETRSERFRLSAAGAPARPRRRALLPQAPVPDSAPDRGVRTGCDRRGGSVRRSGGSARPPSCARATTPVIVEVHGDWRTFTRLYGSPARRLARSRSRIGSATFVLRRADATRALSGFTSGLIESVRGEPATAIFPTYSDLSAFVAEPVKPLPAQTGRRLRRDARGVQEHRRTGGRVATRGRRRAPRGATRDHRDGESAADRRRSDPRPPGSGRVSRAAAPGRHRSRARRGDAARAAVVARGPRPGDHRGVRPRQRCRRHGRRGRSSISSRTASRAS